MKTNRAAWIDAPYADLVVRESERPAAGPNQVVVEVRALAVNPLDAIVQSNGRVMYRWLPYPVVMGEDVAGVIVEVGEDVVGFGAGDRVVAYAMGLEKGRDAVGGGGFQAYVAVEAALTSPVPDSMALEDAVVLPLAFSTAAAGLFEEAQLGLDYSRLGAAANRDDVVVVWGGATSVGGNAIQLARAAGYRVVATASPRHHGRIRRLGAEEVYDYRDPDVVEQVVAGVRGCRVAGVLAVAVGSAEPCVKIARATGARRVAMASPPVSFYDQPRRAGLSLARLALFARLGLRSALLQVRSRIAGIAPSFIWGSSIATSPVGPAVWQSYLPTALASGIHQTFPPPKIVGDDLSAIQGAVDTLRDGMSAEKLVITLGATG